MITKQCKECGNGFEVDDTKRNWQRMELCSDACQRVVSNRRSREKYSPIDWPQHKVCIRCSAGFLVNEGGNMAQKYCGPACQLAAKEEKRAEGVKSRLVPKKCGECGVAFIAVKYSAHKQRFCSDECRRKSRNKQQYASGADKAKVRNGYRYDFRRIRPQILERDGHKCIICGGTERLHAHHWDNSGGTEQVNNAQDNLSALCGVCHYAIHGVTVAKVKGKWVVDGKIFSLLGLTGEISIKE